MTERRFLVVAHTGRDDSLDAAVEVCRGLVDAGAVPVMVAEERAEVLERAPDCGRVLTFGSEVDQHDLELAIVLGGDGTILRGAELVRESATPLLGINLGHVGFLAELEREGLSASVGHALAREYEIENRMTLEASVEVDGETVFTTWALNEAAVEKSSRERMLEVAIEVDARPLSSFGCDGVIMSTPTGSTAYSFSAGGPVVWPSLDAILMVPLSAHALFARPIIVGPESVLAVELLERNRGTGVLWCDGRRGVELPPGARVIVRRSETPVRVARLEPGPFTDRLVHKFRLPVSGWRGPARESST